MSATSCGPAADRVSSAPPARGVALPDSGPGGCYLLALGPAVEPEARIPVAIPTALELRPAGRLAGAAAAGDFLTEVDADLGGHWERLGSDSVVVRWAPHWLGGSLKLKLASPHADTLRGRYDIQPHGVSDGRHLWRGDALAVRARCVEDANGRYLAQGAELRDQQQALVRWQAMQLPDTATAVVEALAAFEQTLRWEPVHSLTLLNYSIAEFVCRRGQLPQNVEELRASSPPLEPPVLTRVAKRRWQDAWGKPLLFGRRGARGYEVRSTGPDGIAHTTDDVVAAYDEVPLKRDKSTDCR